MTTMMVRKRILLSSLVFFFALAGLTVFKSDTAYAYANNELVGDSVYLDAGSMSQAQIQAFLSSKGSYLANYNSRSDRDNADVSAAQIIYEAAQDYGMNPQVLLTTLQKEQSLITDPAPSASQLRFAMGYGCPDSGGCSYPGFYNQVDNAAWQFRFNYERANGNNSWWRSGLSYPCGGTTRYYSTGLYPGRNVTFYDDNGTGYATFVIAGAATASFYCYTPHAYNNPQGLYGNPKFGTVGQYYSGSYNMVTTFERWFGSTIGDLVRTINDPTVYLVSGNYKYPIGDLQILSEYYGFGPVRFASSESLSNKITGSLMSHMVGSNNGTLYFVNSGIKLPFTSCADVLRYGYSCGQVNYLTDGQLAKLANGPIMTPFYYTTSGKKFYIDNNKKREVFDDQSLVAAGLTGGVNILQEQGISYLPYGDPVIRTGVVAISRSNGSHYLYDGGKFYPMDGEIGNFNYILGLSHAYFDQQSFVPGAVAPVLNGFVSNASKSISYALMPSGKVTLNNPATWSPSFVSLSDSLINALPASNVPLNNLLVKSQSDSTVFYIYNGKKRPLPSWGDLVNLKVTPFGINTVPTRMIAAVPDGPRMFSPGRLVKSASSPTVYVVRSSTELYSIGSFAFPQDLGLTNEVLTISDSELQAYTIVDQLQTQISCAGTNYVGIQGKLYVFSASKLSQYGLNAANFKDVSTACLSATFSSQPIADFIRTSDGTIYEVQGGVKRAFTNYPAYIAHGGNIQNTIEVSSYFAGIIPSGSVILN